MRLVDLGPRICILGPSNSGKSTLALAIARARDLPLVHLDQLYHQPGSDWQPRPEAEFIALHDAAILGDSWVIEGNYSRALPQRLARATGVIRLEVSPMVSLARYVRRTWFERARVGGVAKGRDRLKWLMIRHILITTPGLYQRDSAMFASITLPKIRLAGRGAMAGFYRGEGLGG